ncbi:MAG: hypothetical protein A3I78_11765 [Gammaproteobacteria bacterium RIFCSPLOWO2_02_FULL_56_15]|nr:MAG: hypothetical protein A3I78_11765 [Gammaproteobacteria bacterium RIFCSPLOWO2_02_FULL_56_15]
MLNSAPVIIQGAGKLIQLIRERDKESQQLINKLPNTLDGLKEGLQRLDQHLDENDKSDIEQIRLIQELARQNEVLTESLNRTNQRVQVITVLCCIALAMAITGIFLGLRLG